MKTQNKSVPITMFAIVAIVLGFIIFVLIGLKKRENELEKNPEYSLAVIVDTYVGAKARDFVKYEFVVNGKIYNGDQNYTPHRQVVNIGDSCEVVYANSNPKICKLVTDSDNLLKIK